MYTSQPVRPADLRDVTVVVRVCDHAASIDACFESLLAQSIGVERMDVVAVDDGSSDNGPSLLARIASRHPTLVRTGRQPIGVRPAAARTWGLSQATGRYVMFLEGSDRLVPDALERMVASADKHETDVVLGRPESLAGRSAPAALYRRSRPHTGLYDSRVYWSLSADKLFRTDLLRRRALEFPLDSVPGGDDMAFTAAACVSADGISVVADSPCLVNGPGRTTARTPMEWVDLADYMMRVVSSLLPEGTQRDYLLSRHFEIELGTATGALLDGLTSRDERERVSWAARDVLNTHLTPGTLSLLPRPLAVRLALLSAGRFGEMHRMIAYETDKEQPAPRKTVEGGRVFTTLPFFRDPDTALPDDLFDITDRMTVSQQLTGIRWTGSILGLDGFAFFEQLSTRDRATKVVLRERISGAEERFSVTARRDEKLVNSKGKPRAMGRYSARVNLRQTSSGWPVAPGIWDIYLSVSFEGITKEVRVGRERAQEVDLTSRAPVHIAPSPTSAQHELVATLFCTEAGDLSIEMAERLPLPAGSRAAFEVAP
ncbi:glycosyltransferase family A protein [Streptomyces sp. NPDC048430]|uniref:glycosyltransferase family 2 protein n=1 Tax=Streptomyces sp. NPDC048430 TaxID=3155388 RepID=UPI003433A204